MNSQNSAIIGERGKYCFGCGNANPQGLQLKFVIDADGPGPISATATVQLTCLHEGNPGFLHGGIIATLMDEAMSKLNSPLGVLAMTRHIEVDYLRPSPVDTPLTLRGFYLRRDGRKLFHSAELSDATGKVLAKAKGFFLVIDPSVIARS